MADRSPRKIRRFLANRQIQSFDERRVERRGIFRLRERLLESPLRSDDGLPFDFHDSVVPPCLDHLRVETRRSENLSHDSLDAQRRDFVEGRATMLQTVVRRAPRRTERISACRAAVAPTLPRLRFVIAVSDDVAM